MRDAGGVPDSVLGAMASSLALFPATTIMPGGRALYSVGLAATEGRLYLRPDEVSRPHISDSDCCESF